MSTKKTIWRNTGNKLFFKDKLRVVYQNDASEKAVKMKVGQRMVYEHVPESKTDSDTDTESEEEDGRDPWSEVPELLNNPNLLDNYTALWASQKNKTRTKQDPLVKYQRDLVHIAVREAIDNTEFAQKVGGETALIDGREVHLGSDDGYTDYIDSIVDRGKMTVKAFLTNADKQLPPASWSDFKQSTYDGSWTPNY